MVATSPSVDGTVILEGSARQIFHANNRAGWWPYLKMQSFAVRRGMPGPSQQGWLATLFRISSVTRLSAVMANLLRPPLLSPVVAGDRPFPNNSGLIFAELPHSHSTPVMSTSACTKVLYFTDRSLTPFMVNIPKRWGLGLPCWCWCGRCLFPLKH